MAVTKEIYVANRFIGDGTGIKGSPQITRSTTITFTGARGNGLKDVPHTLEIGKIQSNSMEDLMALRKLMISMREESQPITIAEHIIQQNGERFTFYRHYHACLVDGDDYEINAEDLTAETLKFAAEGMTESYE